MKSEQEVEKRQTMYEEMLACLEADRLRADRSGRYRDAAGVRASMKTVRALLKELEWVVSDE